MKFKSYPAEFKVDVDKGEFEGYASVFGNKDAGGDIVEKGAFAKTIQEFGRRVKVLWQHNPWVPIGRPLHMEEDSKGLFTKSKVAPTTQGKDALILMKEGVVNELSIGYDTIKESYDRDSETRHLLEVKLWEFSPVTWAMNDLAVVTGVKSLEELQPLFLKMQDLNLMLKEGRVLSKRNRDLIKQAIDALQALLSAAEDDPEPDKSTQAGGSDKGAASDTDNEPVDHSLDELLQSIKGLGSTIASEQEILRELRDFGKTIRKVN